MINSRTFRFFFCGVLVLGFSSAAFAQATRTWVSGVGDDVNPCSRTAPCKTFAGAISKTAEGGEIDALDPAGYGTLTITKAMTIDGGTGSGWASVLNSGGISGFNVNITTGTHVSDAMVILRNITIQGASQAPTLGGLNGINIIKVNRLFVDACHIENQTGTGINANLASAGAAFVRDCDIENTNAGIKATTTVAPFFVDAKNISVHGNTDGVLYNAGTSGTVTHSYFARIIGGNAILAANGTFVNVTHNHFRSNSTAINAAAGSTVRVNENELFDNTNGFGGTAASFQSGGTNKLAGNGASVTPTGPAVTTQ
jgi:hypothetical protein